MLKESGAKEFASDDILNYVRPSHGVGEGRGGGGECTRFYFYRPALRHANWCFTGNGSWFIAGIFLQSTCRPRGQQLTRVYATRIELQCFSVTIVRVATWCTPRCHPHASLSPASSGTSIRVLRNRRNNFHSRDRKFERINSAKKEKVGNVEPRVSDRENRGFIAMPYESKGSINKSGCKMFRSSRREAADFFQLTITESSIDFCVPGGETIVLTWLAITWIESENDYRGETRNARQAADSLNLISTQKSSRSFSLCRRRLLLDSPSNNSIMDTLFSSEHFIFLSC